jgi:hypothetical protein
VKLPESCGYILWLELARGIENRAGTSASDLIDLLLHTHAAHKISHSLLDREVRISIRRLCSLSEYELTDATNGEYNETG